MPPVAFNPNEQFEEESTISFDPSQPFEEDAAVAPAFNPSAPFKVDSAREAKRADIIRKKKEIQDEGEPGRMRGFVENEKVALGNLATGAANIVPATLRTIGDTAAFLNRNVVNLGGGEKPEDMATYQAGEAIQKQLDRLPTDKEGDPDFWLKDIPQGIGQLGAMAATGGAAKAAGVGLKGAGLIASTSGFGMEFDDAMQSAVQKGDDPDTAFAKSLGYATVATMIENLGGAGRLFRKLAPNPADAAKLLTKWGVTKELAGNFIAGYAEEAGQRIAQNVIVNDAGTVPEVVEGANREGMVGSLLQGVAGGGASIPNIAVARLEAAERAAQPPAVQPPPTPATVNAVRSRMAALQSQQQPPTPAVLPPQILPPPLNETQPVAAPVVPPEVVAEAPVKPVEAPRVENAAERYDRLKAKKESGTLTDPVEIEQFEAQDKVQKQLAGQAAFAEMKAQLEKNAAKQKADLHARGYNESRQENMTPEQKIEALKEEIPSLEADARRFWELRDQAAREPDLNKSADITKANLSELERIKHRNTKDQGQPPERPADMGPEPVRQKTPPVEVKPEVKAEEVKPVKRTHKELVAAKKEFTNLMHEWGEKLGFITDLNRYAGGIGGRIKRGHDTGSMKGQIENSREVKAAHDKVLRAVGQDPGIKTPAAFAEALPKLHKLIEELKVKESEAARVAEEQAKQLKAERDAEADAAIDAWDAETNKPDEPTPPSPPAAPGDVGPGLGAATLGEVKPEGTGLKNSIGDLERELHGLPEAYQKQIRAMPEVWKEAGDIMAKDPLAGQKLADELKHNPERGMTDVDSAVMLRHKVSLENQKNQAAEDTITGTTPEARAEAQKRFDDLSNQLLDLLDTVKFRGSQWGREGRWRQVVAFEDYSLETMVRAKQVELGRKLTAAERAEVKKLQERIAELEKQLAEKKTKDASGVKSGDVDEAVADTVKKTKAQKAKDKAAGVERDLAAEEKAALDYLKESFAENGDFRETQSVIRKLMELLAESGVTERMPMTDAIHRFLTGIDPTITREQAMDLMSNYGQSRLPSQKPAKVIVRDINAQILSVRKLLDYFKGQRPKLTGQLRDAPSQIQRNLLKMVNEAKKNFKLDGPTDSAKAIKSALDAVNTRLKNRLADLKQEVVTRRKIISERSPSPYNEETLRLKREIEEIKKQHDEIFGTEMSDAQRLALAEKQADRQIAELERQIKTGEIFPKSKEEFNLRSAKLDAAKARLEELKLTRQFAREATQPRPEREARQTESRIKALDKQIAAIEKQIKNDEVFSKGKKVKDPTTDPRMIAREEKLAELKAQREFARERLQPGLDPTEAFLMNYHQRLRRMASKYQERLARGDFEPKPKKTPPTDPETNRLSFKLNQAKAAWHEAMMKDRLAKRSKLRKAFGAGREVLNTSRAVITSTDLSGVLRQGGFITFGHPIRAAKAFPAMFKALRSKEGQHAVNEEIMARPNFPAYQRAKLHLTTNTGKLSDMEEAYMTRWAEHIPIVAASERAYVTFLNRLRADSFDAMAESLGRKGELTEVEAKAVANFINVATGRGSLGAKEQALVGLNTVLFAPRYVASRFQILAGQPMYQGSARTRIAIAKEYGRFLAGIALVYGLAQLDGAELEDDPRSADFGKLKYGKTRVDPLAGLQQVTVLLSRLISGKTITNKGKLVPIRGDKVPVTGSNAYDVMARFLRTKLAPWAGTAVDVTVGKNLVGETVTPGSVAQNMLVPLSMQDILSTMEEQGIPRGTALSILSTFGMGLQTREDKK